MPKVFSDAEIGRYYSVKDINTPFELEQNRKAGWISSQQRPKLHFISTGGTVFDGQTIASTYWNSDNAFVVVTNVGCKLFYLGPGVPPFEAYKDEEQPHMAADYRKALQEYHEVWEFVGNGKQQ